MNELFSPRGLHLNFMRVPIGASDFTVTGVPYSYDDLPPGRTDPQLQHFSIRHDRPYIIPALREMRAVNPSVEILASLWSPPPWMKANDAFDNLYGAGWLLPRNDAALANYFVRFLRAYRQAGVPIDAVTAQNEPLSGTAYPGSDLPAFPEGSLIFSHLQPALNRAGLRTKIYGVDGGNNLGYAWSLLSTAARRVLSGIAWHCYGGMGAASSLHQAYPYLDQIVSECSPGIIPYSGAEAAISATRNWASAVALWNLALDPAHGPVQAPNSGCGGCTGVVTVSEQTHRAYLGANYYQLGQLSKYVQPGAVRIASDRFAADFRTLTGGYGVTPGLDDVAFLNPDASKVLVATNTSPARIRFAVAWHGLAIRYALAPGATVTFTWK
jgi:glucosylceramidase